MRLTFYLSTRQLKHAWGGAIKPLKYRLSIVLCFVLALLSAKATNVHFDLSAPQFNASPAASRSVTLQPMSPFAGNLLFFTSSTNGTFTFTNAQATLYLGVIKAPPGAINFAIYVTGTNLGTVEASSITASPGSQTYPAGATAWSIQTSDQRYALSGTASSNLFYPLTSNPSNYFTGTQVTNAILANGGGGSCTATNITGNATNQVLEIVTNNSVANLNGRATNLTLFPSNSGHILSMDDELNDGSGLWIADAGRLNAGIGNGPTASFLLNYLGGGPLTNPGAFYGIGIASVDTVVGITPVKALALESDAAYFNRIYLGGILISNLNRVNSSISAGTNVTVQTNGTIYTVNANPQTNAVVFTNQFVYATNYLATNGLAQLQATNAALQSLINTLGSNATNNDSVVSNGIAARFIPTNALPGLTNGFITSAITNGFATTNFVNTQVATASNALAASVITASNLLQTTKQPATVNLTNWSAIATGSKADSLNGQITNVNVATALSIGGSTTFLLSSSVVGITNGIAQGTYLFYSSPQLFTNLNNPAWTIGTSAGTDYLYSNGVAMYSSASVIGQYAVIGGAPTPAPYVFGGGFFTHNGWVELGYSSNTNLNSKFVGVLSDARLNSLVVSNSMQASRIILDSTYGQSEISSGNGTFEEEGIIRFATGTNTQMLIDSGENNSLKFRSDSEISFDADSYSFTNGDLTLANGWYFVGSGRLNLNSSTNYQSTNLIGQVPTTLLTNEVVLVSAGSNALVTIANTSTGKVATVSGSVGFLAVTNIALSSAQTVVATNPITGANITGNITNQIVDANGNVRYGYNPGATAIYGAGNQNAITISTNPIIGILFQSPDGTPAMIITNGGTVVIANGNFTGNIGGGTNLPYAGLSAAARLSVTNAALGAAQSATNAYASTVTNIANSLITSSGLSTNLNKYNVNTNLYIAGRSQEEIYTNWIWLQSFTNTVENTRYEWNSTMLQFTNSTIYSITNTGAQLRLVDNSGNILHFKTGSSPQGAWSDNLETGSGVGDWGRLEDFGIYGNSGGRQTTNTGFVKIGGAGNLNSLIVTNSSTLKGTVSDGSGQWFILPTGEFDTETIRNLGTLTNTGAAVFLSSVAVSSNLTVTGSVVATNPANIFTGTLSGNATTAGTATNLAASYYNTNDIWISPVGVTNANYSANLGSIWNPYVTTNATQFDTLMNGTNYVDIAILDIHASYTNYYWPFVATPVFPTNSHIHLMAGTFKTRTGFTMFPVWWVQGSGIDITFIKVEDFSPVFPANAVVGGQYAYRSYNKHDLRIGDLTIDLNMGNQILNGGTGRNDSAIVLSGDNSIIENYKIINCGTTDNGVISGSGEQFLIQINNPTGVWYGYTNNNTTRNGIIRNGIIGAPASIIMSNGISAITCFAGGIDGTIPSYTNWIVGMEIYGNSSIAYITNGTGIGQPLFYHHLPIAGTYSTGIRIHDNLTANLIGSSSIAYYQEDLVFSDVYLYNNTMVNVGGGIIFVDPFLHKSGTNLVIKNNIIRVGTTNGDGIKIVSGSGNSSNWFKNVTIEGNFVAPLGVGMGSAFQVVGVTNLIVRNNIFDAGTPSVNGFDVFVNTNSQPNIIYYGNYRMNGSIPSQPASIPVANYITNTFSAETIVSPNFIGGGLNLTNISATNLVGTIQTANLTNVTTIGLTIQGDAAGTNWWTFNASGEIKTNSGTGNNSLLTATTARFANSNNVIQTSSGNTSTGGVMQTVFNATTNGINISTNWNLYHLSNGVPVQILDANSSIADARLSSNVPLLNSNNIFTGANTFTNSMTIVAFGITNIIQVTSNSVLNIVGGVAGWKTNSFGTNGSTAFHAGTSASGDINTTANVIGGQGQFSIQVISPVFKASGNVSFDVGSATTPMVTYKGTNHQFNGAVTITGLTTVSNLALSSTAAPVFNGNGITNINAANVSGTFPSSAIQPIIIQTNFISGNLYSNTYGCGITVMAKIGNSVAAVNGASDMALVTTASPTIGGWTNDISYGTTIGVTIAMTYTNVLSLFVPTNSVYYFTNLSSGAGNSASVVGGQIKYP